MLGVYVADVSVLEVKLNADVCVVLGGKEEESL